jgi:hypothetical protein
MIIPFRFHILENAISVGGYPSLKNYRFMKRLALKTIIALLPEEPVLDLVEFCSSEEIQLVVYKSKYYKENVCLTVQQVNEIIEKLIDCRNFPIYMFCLNGCNVTHQIVMCLRKLQNWSMSSIKSEALRFCDEIVKDEYQFVKDWEGEIRVPEGNIPAWSNELWWLGDLVAHPSVRLKFSTEKKKSKKTDQFEKKYKQRIEYPPYVDLLEPISGGTTLNSLLHSLSLELNPVQTSVGDFDSVLPKDVLDALEKLK